ncbi:uncharacterized protein N7446_007076 [Penicillium canescens]|uniref:uncharacterized protein n=1 Tax=Penicillium canescens TaxID=5083 RepID=UPI0026DF6A44|nr:uncharacterized protein N7446_007076 [Penicillium canescens]KAJ6062956.1 hypothetical protein N7446_007076 [Penicillium canescens]
MGSIRLSSTEYEIAVSSNEGLGGLFYQRMLEDPSAKAIIDEEGRSLTYRALHWAALELAHSLHKRDFKVEEPVGILVYHGIWDAITQVAIIYAGGTCIPLDPLLSDQQVIGRLRRLGARYILVDEPNMNQRLCRFVASLSFMCHTTLPYQSVQKTDVVGHAHSTSFDITLFEIWGALIHGATIGVLTKSTLLDIHGLGVALRRLGITIMVITAPLVNLAATTCPATFAPLRVILMGGEAVNLVAMKTILVAGPPEHLINAYGPTECCVYCLTHEITMADIDAGCVSIGKPIGHNVCCVCDDAGRILPDGEEGELLVGGPGVSIGYFDQPDKNSESFIFVAGMDDPVTGEPYRMYRTGDMVRRRSDGQHEFLGRRDHQVKVRGFRIELSAVDAAVMNTGQFSEVVAMRMDAKEKGAGSTLVAFVVLRPTAGSRAVSDAIGKLRATLPDYMIPHIEVLTKLPLNSHAKLDRRMLSEMYHQRRAKCLNAGFETGLSTRAHVSGIWAAILATPVPRYSDEDDFFAHGATSLQASLLISQIRQQLKTEISLLTLYENSTLGKLVSIIESSQGASTPTVRNEREMWVADTLLADDLPLPCGPVVDWRLDTEGRVFLTGGTGFLGAYMLADLLSMPSVYQVGCLVRAADAVAGLERLKAALVKYGIWRDAFLLKLLPLCGKLEDYWLGLGKRRFGQIAQWASVVFHLGAKVNYTQPYSFHRSANIIGTVNVVRLAVTGRLKGLHYCSSISCFGPTGFVTGAKLIYEDAPLLPHLDALKFDHGYAQSQWAADELLRRLTGRGFPITIYRPGFITGDHNTGACNPDDFFSRLIRASLDLGCYPDLPNQRKEFIPVGYVVGSMLHISSNIFASGHAFHLVPRGDASLGIGDAMELLGKVKGVSIHCVSYEEWIEKLSASTNLSLQPLLPMLAEKVYQGLSRWELYANMPIYDDTNTMRALKTYPGGLECPQFDFELMKRYVEYLVGP